MFNNFKCPNGLSPEDCRHIPQLIYNLSLYFERKTALKAAELKNQDSLMTNSANQSANQNLTRQKQKTRG